jgi:predicted peroxiredoxin
VRQPLPVAAQEGGEDVTALEIGRVDVSQTWKPYRVAYEIIKALRGQEVGAAVEVVTKDDKGILTDVGTWCEATGHELMAAQRHGDGLARVLVRKREPRHNSRTMTVVMSTASLEHAVYPLDKALGAAVLGMGVHVVFEGAGVRLLERGYRPKLSGLVGALFTSMVERVMRDEIGWPPPQESILILEDLGARFYVCGPSMFGYDVREEDLIVRDYTIGAAVTWADLLARTDVHVFSKAQFEKP